MSYERTVLCDNFRDDALRPKGNLTEVHFSAKPSALALAQEVEFNHERYLFAKTFARSQEDKDRKSSPKRKGDPQLGANRNPHYTKQIKAQIHSNPRNNRLQNTPEPMEVDPSTGNNSIILPARSQVVRKIKIDSIEDSLLIPNQEIEHGIYIANTIAFPENAFIRLLNTTNADKVVRINKLNYESLSNYDVVQSSKENREKSLLSQLSKNFPPQFRTQLSTLCAQYSDVFALETESLSTNNFYKQKLRLKDEEPVYIKNYRSPHSQKDEIQAHVQN